MERSIDREKVIKGLEKCKRCECDDCAEKGASHAPWDCPAYDDLIDSAINLLNDQEHSGTWEWITEDEYRCSECKSVTYVDECMNKPQYLYCPYCGCKMTYKGIWGEAG